MPEIDCVIFEMIELAEVGTIFRKYINSIASQKLLSTKKKS
ncbi:Uncharacterised protein [Orientia tsutsugamushi str. Gilliam]|uniref:Uncharacterized protein n=1 Tax=Orientia tsutsugamushi str. Gilliam TaxID=1359184 RepID=A0A2U3RH04_ORITS|nr:hypothetical protein [Orientia tsutsugamushi]SPR12514.1 Uncharacterised protein [Orientia tsutsugamushi str. Gilliam]